MGARYPLARHFFPRLSCAEADKGRSIGTHCTEGGGGDDDDDDDDGHACLEDENDDSCWAF